MSQYFLVNENLVDPSLPWGWQIPLWLKKCAGQSPSVPHSNSKTGYRIALGPQRGHPKATQEQSGNRCGLEQHPEDLEGRGSGGSLMKN